MGRYFGLRWRADRARERATEARALKMSVAVLKERQVELSTHYDTLAEEPDRRGSRSDSKVAAALLTK